MEAKQKAEQLVNRFRTETDTILMTNLAKPFALIAVDEMIKTLSHEPPRPSNRMQTAKYWKEVKTEIDLL